MREHVQDINNSCSKYVFDACVSLSGLRSLETSQNRRRRYEVIDEITHDNR